MKKLVIIIALIAMVVVPVAAAKGVAAVGVELGQPTGITFDYKIDNKWDGYTTVAFGFGGSSYIDAVIGGQVKVTDFNIDKAKFDVNVGLQSGILFFFGDTSGLRVAVRGTASVSYDWTWKNVGDFTAYIRAALGYGIALSDNLNSGFSGAAALGLVYHL